MQIVKALQDANVLDEAGQPTYRLRRRQRYLLYDQEVRRGIEAGALRGEARLDDVLPPYRGEVLDQQRLILPFIGRAGDAVAAASCISALVDAFPGATVDVACPAYAAETLRLFPELGDILPYPMSMDDLARYDYHLSFEEVESVPDGARRSCADLFSTCMRTPRPSSPPHAVVPAATAESWHLGADGPRVAVHVGDRGDPRTYPAEHAIRLVGLLVDAGYHVFLIGAAMMSVNSTGKGAERVHSMLGQTPTAADLAALLEQMDAVVTGDSFPMHLSGALDVPTVAVFTATDPVLADDYPSVTATGSGAACSPCHAVGNGCPLGHERCIAHDDAAIAPQHLFEAVTRVARTDAPVGARLSR